MTPLEKFNFFLSTYGRMFVALFNVRLWPPFLLYLIVMMLIVLGVQSMFSPLLSGWVIPLVFSLMRVVSLGGTNPEFMLHYPGHLAGLPYAFQCSNVVPSLFLESLLTSAGVLMFVAYFRQQSPVFGSSVRAASRYYGRIVLIWLVNVVLVMLLFTYLPGLFRDFVHGSPRREIALMIGMQGLSALLSALFIYAIPYLVVRNRSLGACFAGSFSLFFKHFFTTYFLVGIPQFVTLFLIIPLQSADTIVLKFNPGVVLWLTYGMTVMFALTSFFTTGSIVRFFLETSEE
jgi:hypothetical protein